MDDLTDFAFSPSMLWRRTVTLPLCPPPSERLFRSACPSPTSRSETCSLPCVLPQFRNASQVLRASKVHSQVAQETDQLPLRHSHSFQQTTDLQVGTLPPHLNS